MWTGRILNTWVLGLGTAVVMLFIACEDLEVHHPDTLTEIIEQSEGSTVVWEAGKADTVAIVLDHVPGCYSYVSFWLSDPAQATAFKDSEDSLGLEWDPHYAYFRDTWFLPRNIIIEALDDSLKEGDMIIYLHLDGGSFCSGLNGSSQLKVTIKDND